MTVVGVVFGVFTIIYFLLVGYATLYQFSRINNKKQFRYIFLLVEFSASSLFIILSCFLDWNHALIFLYFWVTCRVGSFMFIYKADQKLIQLNQIYPPNNHKYKQQEMFQNTNQGIKSVNDAINESFIPKVHTEYETYRIESREFEYYDQLGANEIIRRAQFFHDPKKGPLQINVQPQLVREMKDVQVTTNEGEYDVQILGYSNKHDQMYIYEDESIYTVLSVNYSYKWLGESASILMSLNSILENKIQDLDDQYEINTTDINNHTQQFVIFNKDLYELPYTSAQKKIPKWINRKFILLYWVFAFLFQLECFSACYLENLVPRINQEVLSERNVVINVECQLSVDPNMQMEHMLYQLKEHETLQNLIRTVVHPTLTKVPIVYQKKESVTQIDFPQYMEPDATEFLVGSVKDKYTGYV
ncbi:Hypothetical_protein [Hexamita inflata]|uniref:Hypothetical_protein n=1 Tax=Hexamita inflata TaxID=28002 RepID=A0AA86R1K1_9EUKA|nr:Hypothetical protein HINF_LOCUS51579 [Hexamita inflata]